MIGLLLAGGYGTRLRPVTSVISKQLLPIYDKPMIYYPISLLMAASIRDICIVTTPRDAELFKQLLGTGEKWGVNFNYFVQSDPNGIPEVFLLTENVISGQNTTLMLGDNLFYGSQMGKRLKENCGISGALMYGYLVNDVSQFGTFRLSPDGSVISLIEKPKEGGKGFAIPGVYHFDSDASDRTKNLTPSKRGELEIIDLLNSYFIDSKLGHSIIDRGTAWLDTGTIEDMSSASELVRVVQSRQGMLIGSPEEVAFRNGWISSDQLMVLAQDLHPSPYGKSLVDLIEG